MKILHVINSFEIGGAEKLVCSYILESKDKHRNYVITLKGSKSFLNDILIENGIDVKEIYGSIPILRVVKLINNIRKEKYNIVHVHLFPSSYYCAAASIFCRKSKFIFTEHSVTNKRRNIKWLKHIESKMYKCFDRVVACSEEVKKELAKWIGNDVDIIAINNGIRGLAISDEEQEYDIILIGSLRSDVKGVDILLNSLSRIKGSFNKAIIIGDGIEKGNLLNLRKNLELDEKVEFLGIRYDVDKLLSKSKIFVMPSRYEGLPISLLEAMSLKKAIIASDVSQTSKIIKDRESGFIFNINNIEELSRAIITLLNNENERIRLGENAYREFKKGYGIEKYCISIDNLYRDIIK